MPTAPPTLTPAPTSPDRADRATFAARAVALDDWTKNNQVPEMQALGGNVYANAVGAAADAATATGAASAATTQAGNASTSAAAAAASAASALTAPGTSATSTTSTLIGYGATSLTIQSGKSYSIGQTVMLSSAAGPATNWMWGQITSYNSGTGALVVAVTIISGSGTFADWTISLSGNPGAALPSQTGNAGKVPTTNGTIASWSSLKTISGESLLGAGDVSLAGGSTTTSSAVDMTLTAASTRVQVVTMTAADKKITLPDATTLSTGGAVFVVTNAGALRFAVRANGGGLLGNILPSQTAIVYLTNNSTAEGVWSVGSDSATGLFSTPLPGTVTSINAATTTGVGITALSSTLALIVYKENAGNIIARTLTISGTTITVNAALTVVASGGALCPVVAVSATQAVVCYTNSGGTSFDACTLNISGTTVTAGAAITVISGYAGSSAGIQKRSSTEVVVNVGWSTVNVGVYPISISGTTLSLGTAANTGSGSVAINSFALLTSTLGVHSIQTGSTQQTNYGYVTFSGSVATMVGTYTKIDSPATASDRLVTPSSAMLTSTRFLTVGDQFMGAASPAIKVWLGESPTNTSAPSFAGGVTVAYAKDGSSAPKIQRITDTTAMLTWMGSAGFIYACEISVNGSTITAGPVVALNAVSSSAPVICSLSSGAQVVAYIGTSSYAQAVVLENA